MAGCDLQGNRSQAALIGKQVRILQAEVSRAQYLLKKVRSDRDGCWPHLLG